MLPCHRPLIAATARKLQPSNREDIHGDLINEGYIALINAIERFDPSLGFALSTYALWVIRAAITETIRRYRYDNAICQKKYAVITALTKTMSALGMHYSMDYAALAAALDWPVQINSLTLASDASSFTDTSRLRLEPRISQRNSGGMKSHT